MDAEVPGVGDTDELISEEAGGVVDEAATETSGTVGTVLGALTGTMVVGAAIGLAVGILVGLVIGRRAVGKPPARRPRWR